MTQPTKWSAPLGSGADVQDLPDDDLRYASFSKIFPQITQVPLSAGGVAPRRIDFNSLFKLLADNIYYYQNGGVFEYSDTADYEKGAIVRYNDKIYLCIQDNSALNVHNPEDMNYWLRVALNNELSDYLPLTGGNLTGNLSVQNKNVVRTINDVEADVNGNVVIEIGASKADIDLSNVTAPTRAFKNMSVGWSMPDYTSGIDIGSNFATLGGSWTAPSDGFIEAVANTPSSPYIFLYTQPNSNILSNANVFLKLSFSGSDSNAVSTIVPVLKGQTVYQTSQSPYYFRTAQGKITFYPCKGAN